MDGELFNQRQNMSAILALSILVILAGCTSSPQQTQTSSTMLETANTRENITLIVDECNGTLRKPSDKDVLYQYSTINALLQGVYDGGKTFGMLREHGDFGLGTFNTLDGEMVAVDGEFYQVPYDGRAVLADDSMKTPFAAVTFFEPDVSHNISGMNLTALQAYIDENTPSENIFYAILVNGTFSYAKTRSVPAQEKPYPLLADAVKNQSVFEFHNVTGILVGFKSPKYVDGGINVAGYHLHFLTTDRTAGGHLLDVEAEEAVLQIDYTDGFMMELPDTKEFLDIDLSGKKEEELKAVEGR